MRLQIKLNTISNIFGFGAMFSLFCSYQQKTRRRFIIAKLSADICWGAHYLFIGATAGAIPNFIGIFREIVFVNRNDKKWTKSAVWPVLFIFINFSLGISTFHSVYNLLPILASTFVTISLWINNIKLTKLISVPVCIAFMIYDFHVSSYIGMINESVSIFSIIIYFIKRRTANMNKHVFSPDYHSTKPLMVLPTEPIKKVARTITSAVSEEIVEKGNAFAEEISNRFVSDFEKAEDKMTHVSTFIVIKGVVYMTYYANTKEPSENPKDQTARLVYAPIDDIENKTFIDIQTTGDIVDGKIIDMVYDTILMQK